MKSLLKPLQVLELLLRSQLQTIQTQVQNSLYSPWARLASCDLLASWTPIFQKADWFCSHPRHSKPEHQYLNLEARLQLTALTHGCGLHHWLNREVTGQLCRPTYRCWQLVHEVSHIRQSIWPQFFLPRQELKEDCHWDLREVQQNLDIALGSFRIFPAPPPVSYELSHLLHALDRALWSFH